MTATLHCMTCLKDYEPASPMIHTRVALLDDWCICRECVDVAQKRAEPEKHDKD
jgi:hypothetical protein